MIRPLFLLPLLCVLLAACAAKEGVPQKDAPLPQNCTTA